jgi:uncharacterized membrane protein
MKKIYESLRKDFLFGMVAILPIYVTIRVILALVGYIDKSVAPHLQALLPYPIPGLGLLTTLVAITLGGFLMRFLFFRRVGSRLDTFMESIPLVRTVYTTVKQVLLPLVGDEKHQAFKQVVAFEWPGNDMWVVGFLVKEIAQGPEPLPEDEVIVFLPTNHLHLGFVIATRRAKLRVLDMTIEDALRTQFSLGVAAPVTGFLNPSQITQVGQIGQIGKIDQIDLAPKAE